MKTFIPELDACAKGWQAGWESVDMRTVSEWGRKNVVLVGSALKELSGFDPDETPWIVDVINDSNPASCVHYSTFVKPVQAGGSVAGEVVLMRLLKKARRGDIQYNWESDEKARERWKKRVEKIILATQEILDLLPKGIGANTKFQTCLIILDRLNFTMQGVESKDNLASDSIRYQVNEEIHNWEAGKLDLAYGRATAYEPIGFHILNISNASTKGDQLHKALLSGTNRQWEVKCQGCGLYHAMQARWDDAEPEMGGLRYDSDGCKQEDGSYDYNRLAPTIRYQMPCGREIRDNYHDRLTLSRTGRYSAPRNPGAHKSNESRTLEAVSVHYISWRMLIEQKHKALRSARFGDQEPWKAYLRERECRFWDPEELPLVHEITIRADVKKNREGLAGRSHRFFALDRQKGQLSKGEFPHWWLLIVDVGIIDGKLTLQVVFEGKVLTDEDVPARLDEHGCIRSFGVADCTFDKTHVTTFCLRHGINAIFATGQAFYSHEGGAKQVFSPEKPLAPMIGAPLKYPQTRRGVDNREPLFWFYSKTGVMDLFHYLRTAPDVQIIIPKDVSKDFRSHIEAFIRELVKQTDGSIVPQWRQVRERPDLFVCFCYISMQMRMAGLIGATVEERKIP